MSNVIPTTDSPTAKDADSVLDRITKRGGKVMVEVSRGMEARIKPEEIEGKRHKGKLFIVDSEPRVLCGAEVVALNNSDGSRFSAAYDLSMLEITDAH